MCLQPSLTAFLSDVDCNTCIQGDTFKPDSLSLRLGEIGLNYQMRDMQAMDVPEFKCKKNLDGFIDDNSKVGIIRVKIRMETGYSKLNDTFTVHLTGYEA